MAIQKLDRQTLGDKMTLRVTPSTREVTASYVVDDSTLQIGVRVPENFPLKQVEIVSGPRVGASEAQWRRWMMSTASSLSTRVCPLSLCMIATQGINLILLECESS